MKHTKFYSVFKIANEGFNVLLTKWAEVHNIYNTSYVCNFQIHEDAREYAQWMNDKGKKAEEKEA